MTAFTLLTVPEDPMLAAYLRTEGSVNASFGERVARVNADQTSILSASGSSRNAIQLSVPGDHDCNNEKTTQGSKVSEFDLELDKFMAALTASESPDAIIKTIVGTKTQKRTRR